MNEITEIEYEIDTTSNDILFREDFNHLKFSKRKEEYVVALVDKKNYEIIKGYGKSTIDAINDLHNNML